MPLVVSAKDPVVPSLEDAPSPNMYKTDDSGRKVCSKKNDKPGKSKKNKGIHLDMECCLDPDEIPNPHCYYPPEKYGKYLKKFTMSALAKPSRKAENTVAPPEEDIPYGSLIPEQAVASDEIVRNPSDDDGRRTCTVASAREEASSCQIETGCVLFSISSSRM